MKTCPSCHEVKPESGFHRNRSKSDDLARTCKACESARQRQYAVGKAARRRQRDTSAPEASAARNRRYYQNRRPRALAEAQERHHSRPLAYIESRYGLTPARFEELRLRQNDLCAICGDAYDRLLIDHDHDHETGTVRGLLCKNCNFALGHLRDNADNAERAAAYPRASIHHALAAGKEAEHVH